MYEQCMLVVENKRILFSSLLTCFSTKIQSNVVVVGLIDRTNFILRGKCSALVVQIQRRLVWIEVQIRTHISGVITI